jgi:signal transduction histidine kinase
MAVQMKFPDIIDDDEEWAQIIISEYQGKTNCISIEILKKMVIIETDKVVFLEKHLTEFFNDTYYALHDIQAPIRTIRLFVEMILNEKELVNKEKIFSYLQRVYKSSINVGEMLNDINDIMALGLRSLEKIEIINFNEVLDDAVLHLHGLIQEKNAHVIYEGKFPVLKANRLRWVRIFQNLISNGILYNYSEIPIVKIYYEDQNIYIEDNGIGIPEDKYQVVFELFMRLSDRSTMAEGTGAGLYMCKKFTQMDRADIHVHHSEMGKGTTFVINIASSL